MMLLMLAPQVMADLKIALQLIPNAELVGAARLKYLLWDVYDAELYAPDGNWRADLPFALSLRYLLRLDGEEIADRSIQEMRKQGFSDDATLAAWTEQMRSIFPDVEKNARLVGIRTESGETHFHYNGAFIGEIKDPAFGQWFFSIWLSESTSQPRLRAQLLGEKTQ